jgi:hypothetical protein
LGTNNLLAIYRSWGSKDWIRPGFRDDTGTLRAAVVSGSKFAGHGKLTRTRGENQGNDLF